MKGLTFLPRLPRDADVRTLEVGTRKLSVCEVTSSRLLVEDMLVRRTWKAKLTWISYRDAITGCDIDGNSQWQVSLQRFRGRIV